MSNTSNSSLDQKILDLYTGIGLGEYSTDDIKALIHSHQRTLLEQVLSEMPKVQSANTEYAEGFDAGVDVCKDIIRKHLEEIEQPNPLGDI